MRIFVSVVAVFGLWYMYDAGTYASCCVPERGIKKGVILRWL